MMKRLPIKLALVWLIASMANGCDVVMHETWTPVYPEHIPICYDYGCATADHFGLSAMQWQQVTQLFSPPAPDSTTERHRIRQAIALMEQLAGTYTPTQGDKGKNPPFEPYPGGMDCIDESINTTTYLRLLSEHHLLQWHTVKERVVRAPILFNMHHAAQIQDISTGQLYVVDSWYLDNGQPPFIQLRHDWLHQKPFAKTQRR